MPTIEFKLTANELNCPHRPLPGQPFITYTMNHLEMEAKLTPCASLLHHWVLLKAPAGVEVSFKLGDFKAWSGEHRNNGKSYSMKQIQRAVKELEDMNLLTIIDSDVKAVANHPGPVVPLYLPSGQKSQRSSKNVLDLHKNVSNHGQNPCEPTISNSTDLYRSYTETTTEKVENPMVVVEKNDSLIEANTEQRLLQRIQALEEQFKKSINQTNPIHHNLYKSEEIKISSELVEPVSKTINTGTIDTEITNANEAAKALQKAAIDPTLFEPVQLLYECVGAIAPHNMTAGLKRFVLEAQAEVVKNAIAAINQYRSSLKSQGKKISNPSGMLRRAISEQWQPVPDAQMPKASTSAPADFVIWFNKAREKGLVVASQLDKESGVILCYTGDKWLPYPHLASLYPLD